jgi:hypothetical protein
MRSKTALVYGLAILGLLCHLLIFLSLFFPFADLYDPYVGLFRETGWQVIGNTGILIPFLILPVFPYLACLLPIILKSKEKKELLQTFFSLSWPLNIIPFILFPFCVTFKFGDFDKQTLSMDAAAGIPLAVFLLALFCSIALSILLSLLLRPGAGKDPSSIRNRERYSNDK